MIINSKDLYTYNIGVDLGTVGTTIISYEIRRYRDVRNLGNKLAYQILCTQRIIIPNQDPYAIGPQDVIDFDDYPAAITNNITITNAGGAPPTLIKYTPKTINAAVNISTSSGTGTNTSISHQHTSGSSTSQSNTYGTSVSLGFLGDGLTGGISSDYNHTSSSDRSNSESTGGEVGSNNQSSGSEAMSVKDWCCYSYIDTKNSAPTWVWGQEYPWDVIKFNNDNSTTNIVLPDFVAPLLYNNTQALPPSQLSLFGIDFTMKSVWIVEPTNTGTVTITHDMKYCTASHGYSGTSSFAATISAPQSFIYTTTQPIDLCTYGLDPITNISAIIGFIPNKFIICPIPASVTSKPTPFKIISQSNNLMIKDTSDYSKVTSSDPNAGFSASETALTTTFTQNCTTLEIQLSFKIVDTTNGYTLFLKHWKTNTTNVVLQMLINGDTDNVITKYVDAREAEGGENNILSITLRNLDYGSVDYHDFLQLGLNTIQITITPDGSYTTCGYAVRAISIERS